MSITATELKVNLGKYLSLAETVLSGEVKKSDLIEIKVVKGKIKFNKKEEPKEDLEETIV